MNFSRKIAAGALQFVVFISAVIAALLLTFLLLMHTHDLFDRKTDRDISLWQATEDLMRISLAQSKKGSDQPGSDHKDLFSNVQGSTDIGIWLLGMDGAKVTLTESQWGIYDLKTIQVRHGNQAMVRAALVGVQEQQPTALYLRDRNRPLVLAGNARLLGNAELPEAGIRMGSIRGRSYHGDKLIYGKQLKSGAQLPPLRPGLSDGLESFLYGDLQGVAHNAQDKKMDIAYREGMEVRQSFLKPMAVIRGEVINLNEVHLAGHVVVWASRGIRVPSSADLRDVLLVAPKIEIESGVTGRFQAIAKEAISVGENCELSYPSALIVMGGGAPKTTAFQTSQVELRGTSEIRGVIATLGDPEGWEFLPQIKIHPESRVVGEVYCRGNVELKGSVQGKITTSGFLALENGSIYQNHILDGNIDREALHPSYAGWDVEGGETTKTVMQWLY